MYIKQNTYSYEKQTTVSVKIHKYNKYNRVNGKVSKNKKWLIVNQKGQISYILKSDLTTKKPYKDKDTPKNSFKSYMSYKALSNRNSKQYKLQTKATTGKYGIRTIDGRYCVALGSYYTHDIGTKVDLIMTNGNVIKCIVGDAKADIHTDAKHQKSRNGCISEFIVDMNKLNKKAKLSGDMSSCNKTFGKSIKKIRIWNY